MSEVVGILPEWRLHQEDCERLAGKSLETFPCISIGLEKEYYRKQVGFFFNAFEHLSILQLAATYVCNSMTEEKITTRSEFTIGMLT